MTSTPLFFLLNSNFPSSLNESNNLQTTMLISNKTNFNSTQIATTTTTIGLGIFSSHSHSHSTIIINTPSTSPAEMNFKRRQIQISQQKKISSSSSTRFGLILWKFNIHAAHNDFISFHSSSSFTSSHTRNVIAKREREFTSRA